MKFSEDIFKKATVRGIADYLLFGEVPLEEKRDYEARQKMHMLDSKQKQRSWIQKHHRNY